LQQIDLDLTPPNFALDPAATEQMAAYTARIQDILRFILDNTNGVKVLSSAPAANDLFTLGDNKGNTLSEIAILDNATQTNRKLYYKNPAGTLRVIDSA